MNVIKHMVELLTVLCYSVAPITDISICIGRYSLYRCSIGICVFLTNIILVYTLYASIHFVGRLCKQLAPCGRLHNQSAVSLVSFTVTEG